MAFTKCQQCGCVRETLEVLQASAPAVGAPTRELAVHSATWISQIAPIRYARLGCVHCYPAAAINALTHSGLQDATGLACALMTQSVRKQD
jgi:hypothetical protein